MDNIVELNRGPFVGAQEPLGTVDPPDGGSVLDVADRGTSSPAMSTARSSSRSRAPLRHQGRVVLTGDEPVAIYAESAEDAETRRGRSVPSACQPPGLPPHADATEKIDPIDIDELEKLLANGPVEILDVREKNERDEGYIEDAAHAVPDRPRVPRGSADDARSSRSAHPDRAPRSRPA